MLLFTLFCVVRIFYRT